MAAPSENTGGSQTAVISTEHTLATITVAGTYILVVELDNLVHGDILELRIDTKVRSGGSSLTLIYGAFANARGNDDVTVMSPPIATPFEFVATLKQTAGTGREFTWSIYQYT